MFQDLDYIMAWWHAKNNFTPKKTAKWTTHDNKPIRNQKSHPYKKITKK